MPFGNPAALFSFPWFLGSEMHSFASREFLNNIQLFMADIAFGIKSLNFWAWGERGCIHSKMHISKQSMTQRLLPFVNNTTGLENYGL